MKAKGVKTMGKHDCYPSVRLLSRTKKLALRRCIWFRILTRIERAIIDLTIKYVDKIRSLKLVKVVMTIINKLQHAIETKSHKLKVTHGLHLAQRISEIAVRWGNQSAIKWANDIVFACFLEVSTTNDANLAGTNRLAII